MFTRNTWQSADLYKLQTLMYTFNGTTLYSNQHPGTREDDKMEAWAVHSTGTPTRLLGRTKLGPHDRLLEE